MKCETQHLLTHQRKLGGEDLGLPDPRQRVRLVHRDTSFSGQELRLNTCDRPAKDQLLAGSGGASLLEKD